MKKKSQKKGRRTRSTRISRRCRKKEENKKEQEIVGKGFKAISSKGREVGT